MSKIAVLGAGAFGMALAILLEKKGNEVVVWDKNENHIKDLQSSKIHKNLEGIDIPEGIFYSSNLEECLRDCEYILLALPSAVIRENLLKIKALYKNQIIINVAKGIEEDTLLLISEQVEEILETKNLVIMSGPSYAIEIAKEMASSCVLASTNMEMAKKVRDLLSTHFFKLYVSDDIIGVQLGGAAKNVIALAAGISDGLLYGDNTKAALMTRGIAEIARLGVAMGGKLETFFGLSGIGDLIVTCSGKYSRNKRAGILLAKGYNIESTKDEIKMVVEGIDSAKSIRDLALKYKVEMPIVEQVSKILFENKDAKTVLEELMNRDNSLEFYKIKDK